MEMVNMQGIFESYVNRDFMASIFSADHLITYKHPQDPKSTDPSRNVMLYSIYLSGC